MFKTAATKLAHNSTIPALAGNSDLRPLQEVITTEKLVLQSLQRLSTDFGKSSEALRIWGSGEGEDLGDTFSACTTLLNHWISSLASFASHITYIRECLKAVRTREEALDEMHRRRRSLMSKADSADKKLSKMNQDNKNLRQQTDLLMNLREQIRTLDVEIMNEEADLGDWKRTKAREWMGVLFGGLLECSQKGAVVATFGRTIIGHVSTEKTQPGLPRAHYSGHSQVEPLVVKAERELHKISFISQVGDGVMQPSSEYRIGDIPGLPPPSPSSPVRQTPAHIPQSYASSTLPNNPPSNPHELSDFGEYNPYSQPQTYTPGQRIRLSSLDQPPSVSPTKSGPFSPFPPQGGSGFTPGHQPHLSQNSVRSGSGFPPGPPPTNAPVPYPTHSSNNSGSGLIHERKATTDDTFSSSIARALGDGWELNESRNKEPPRLSVDGPPPSYATNISPISSPPGPPGPPHLIERKPVPSHIPEASDEDEDGVGLSYLSPASDDGPSRSSDEKRLSNGGGGLGEDGKVRWGNIRDADMESEERYAEETRKSNEMRGSVSPARYPGTPSSAYQSRNPSPPMPEPHPHVHQSKSVQPAESPTSTDEMQPVPNVSVEDEGPSQLDEKSLNTLAAREISKQMEMSTPPLSPPSLPFAGRRSVSPRPSFPSEIPPSNSGSRFGQILSPPPPPPPHFTSSTLTHELTPSPKLPQPPPPPPAGALPNSKSADSTVSDFTQQDDAYRTPPEYLRDLSTPPSPSMAPVSLVPQVTSTLSSPPSTPPTTKKISAAAFRRPRMRGLSSNTNLKGDSLRQDSLNVGFRLSPGRSPSRENGEGETGDGGSDTSVTPLNVRKKSLPEVPRISTNLLSGPRGSGAPRSISSPFPNLSTNEGQPLGPGRVPPLSSSPESRPRESMFGGDVFDYVSAYMNEDEGKQSEVYNGATNGRGHVGGGLGTSPPQDNGYRSGRFATRLED